MKTRYRDRTAKYKSCRNQPEVLFLSRTLQTFFNKFTKKGKKSLARRHFTKARVELRYSLRLPLARVVLQQSLRKLETPISLVYFRKGNTRENVPVPSRRNKKKSPGLQTLYVARQQRRERDFSERIRLERFSLRGPANQSGVRRAHSLQNSILYTGRVNTKRRWR